RPARRSTPFPSTTLFRSVLLGEGEQDAVLGRGRLQLEVEGPAEGLAQREPPGPVDAAAERGMDDELHAAGIVEEALGDHALLGRSEEHTSELQSRENLVC